MQYAGDPRFEPQFLRNLVISHTSPNMRRFMIGGSKVHKVILNYSTK